MRTAVVIPSCSFRDAGDFCSLLRLLWAAEGAEVTSRAERKKGASLGSRIHASPPAKQVGHACIFIHKPSEYGLQISSTGFTVEFVENANFRVPHRSDLLGTHI